MEDTTAQARVDRVREAKRAIRQRIWETMEKTGVARFPRPIFHRIPNFTGAEVAAQTLAQLPIFRNAQTVKVNPDAPQLPVRRAALQAGKRVLMPAPRLRTGFLLLDPTKIHRSKILAAASIRGAFRYGEAVGLDELPRPDLIIAGSVAVTPDGARIGKGEGYSELEYAILSELGLIDHGTPVATTVHDVQIVDGIDLEPYDVPVDIIVTPTRVIETLTERLRPAGIFWEHISEKMLEEMPVLRALQKMRS